MLSVTNAAMQQLNTTLKSVYGSNKADKCFRIVPMDETSMTLSLSEPAVTDQTFEFDGNTVLALPKELQSYCEDKRLDVNDDGKLEIF